MKVVALEADPSALIFDLDNTLYTNPAYAAFQEDALVRRLGRELGLGPTDAAARIASLRTERSATGLGKTSLGTLFAALGIEIATSVRWREECIEPAAWLKRDFLLDCALGLLSKNYSLALMTNNPRLIGEKSLEALGVRARFSVLVGLDDTLHSKPASEPFKETARRLGVEASRCISIGDRFDVDLAPALELGMGAILVDGVEDVYRLPKIFAERSLHSSRPAGQA
jgi:phosphoglycolate phosphatase/putative hydrolase of the HAD superfamily